MLHHFIVSIRLSARTGELPHENRALGPWQAAGIWKARAEELEVRLGARAAVVQARMPARANTHRRRLPARPMRPTLRNDAVPFSPFLVLPHAFVPNRMLILRHSFLVPLRPSLRPQLAISFSRPLSPLS